VRGEADAAALDGACELTLSLREQHFGSTPEGLWRYVQSCGRKNCSRRNAGLSADKRFVR
jgi:hypothetical protein